MIFIPPGLADFTHHSAMWWRVIPSVHVQQSPGYWCRYNFLVSALPCSWPLMTVFFIIIIKPEPTARSLIWAGPISLLSSGQPPRNKYTTAPPANSTSVSSSTSLIISYQTVTKNILSRADDTQAALSSRQLEN